jgi:archaellum component FlaC
MSFNVTNSADKKKIKDALFEISNSMTRMDAEKELIKDIINDLSDNFELPKKTVRKIAKAYHKQNFNQAVADNEEFQELYESILDVE